MPAVKDPLKKKPTEKFALKLPWWDSPPTDDDILDWTEEKISEWDSLSFFEQQNRPVYQRPPWVRHNLGRASYEILHKVKHTAFWGLGWSDLQLQTIAMVAGFQQDTRNWRYQAALMADGVAEHLLTGNPVRYSRDKDQYTKMHPWVNPFLSSYRGAIDAIEDLWKSGLINHAIGHQRDRYVEGRQSVYWPTAKAIELIRPILNIEARDATIDVRIDVIKLKDGDKKLEVVHNTPTVCRMRKEMNLLNDSWLSTTWMLDGEIMNIPSAARIFARTPKRGGRLYHQGYSYQNFPGEIRALIKIALEDGQVYDTIEKDYVSEHITLAYSKLALPVPKGDLYAAPGWDRNTIKGVILRLFNAKSQQQALNSILWDGVIGDRSLGQAAIDAVKELHPELVRFFGTDAGAKLQRIDSDMAVKVLLRFFSLVGYAPLCVHDSFIVAVQHEDTLDEIMRDVLGETIAALPHPVTPDSEVQDWSPDPITEANTTHHATHTPHHIPLGTTNEPDQRQQDLDMYRAFLKRQDRANGNYPDDWGPEPDIPWHEDPGLLQHRYELASVEAEWKQHRQDCDTRRYRWKWNPLTQEEYDYLTGEQAEDSFHVWRRQREIEILGRPLGHLEWKNTPKNLKRRRLKERTRKATAKELREAKALMISLLGPDFA